MTSTPNAATPNPQETPNAQFSKPKIRKRTCLSSFAPSFLTGEFWELGVGSWEFLEELGVAALGVDRCPQPGARMEEVFYSVESVVACPCCCRHIDIRAAVRVHAEGIH
jgi:hypothetical protein